MLNKEKLEVLITGMGAIIAQGILKSLNQSIFNVNIVGLDKNENTYAKNWCDKFITKPSLDEESVTYLHFWKMLIKENNIDIIFPGVEIDVLFFNNNRSFFEKLNVKIVLNTSELIQLSQDKWSLHQYLLKNKYLTIPTMIPTTWEEAKASLGEPPYILKPTQGNGSRGIVKINEIKDFNYYTEKTNNMLLQKYIGSDDEEYTVGVFGLGEGKILKSIIIFKRILSQEGNTKYAEVVDNPSIEKFIKRICTKLHPIGPTNFQFRIENEQVYLLEINPRFSSSNSLRTSFGFNEAQLSLEYYLFNKVTTQPKIMKGIGWRYLEDYHKVC